MLLNLDQGISECCTWVRLGLPSPLPVIGIAVGEAPSRLTALLQLDVTAHLRKLMQNASI